MAITQRLQQQWWYVQAIVDADPRLGPIDNLPVNSLVFFNWVLFIKNWIWINDYSNILKSIENVTFSEFKSFLTGNKLFPWIYYRITDHASKYEVYWTSEIRTATTEPVLVLALTSNTYNTNITSLTFPSDLIIWDANDDQILSYFYSEYSNIWYNNWLISDPIFGGINDREILYNTSNPVNITNSPYIYIYDVINNLAVVETNNAWDVIVTNVWGNNYKLSLNPSFFDWEGFTTSWSNYIWNPNYEVYIYFDGDNIPITRTGKITYRKTNKNVSAIYDIRNYEYKRWYVNSLIVHGSFFYNATWYYAWNSTSMICANSIKSFTIFVPDINNFVYKKTFENIDNCENVTITNWYWSNAIFNTVKNCIFTNLTNSTFINNLTNVNIYWNIYECFCVNEWKNVNVYNGAQIYQQFFFCNYEDVDFYSILHNNALWIPWKILKTNFLKPFYNNSIIINGFENVLFDVSIHNNAITAQWIYNAYSSYVIIRNSKFIGWEIAWVPVEWTWFTINPFIRWDNNNFFFTWLFYPNSKKIINNNIICSAGNFIIDWNTEIFENNTIVCSDFYSSCDNITNNIFYNSKDVPNFYIFWKNISHNKFFSWGTNINVSINLYGNIFNGPINNRFHTWGDLNNCIFNTSIINANSVGNIVNKNIIWQSLNTKLWYSEINNLGAQTLTSF